MKHKEKILELRSQGLSYEEIKNRLGCSKGTIAYHCGNHQKEKNKDRYKQFCKLSHPFKKKIEHYCCDIEYNIITNKTIRIIRHKIYRFLRDESMKKTYNKPSFTEQDVINKFGEKPKCYLTGKEIDIYDTKTYQFDHIIPRSRGGDNSLENLGICTRDANQAKRDMLKEEFIELCKSVLENNGYKVNKK